MENNDLELSIVSMLSVCVSVYCCLNCKVAVYVVGVYVGKKKFHTKSEFCNSKEAFNYAVKQL